jgi:hypothetical protein
MARGKLKFDWSVYSARRGVTLQNLYESGIVTNYESYIAYCDEMSVRPMTETAFVNEHSKLISVKTSNNLPGVLSEPEEPGLQATVWLSGTKDEPNTEDIPHPQKKKKVKDVVPEPGS